MTTQHVAVQPTAGELLQALGHAVIATDVDGKVVFWNDAAEELYGWPAAEAMGRNIEEVTVPEMSKDVAADVMAALRDGRAWSGGFPVRRRDGGILHALVTDSGVYRDGKLIGIVGASLNLGEAVRHLLERSSDAAVLLDEDEVVTYASPAVVRLFGWPIDHVVGTRLAERVHPDDHKTLWDLLVTVPTQADRVSELRVQTNDGWLWVEVAVTDLYTHNGTRSQVCNIRRSERLARLEERERILQTVHSEVLQDLFVAALELDRVQTHGSPPGTQRVDAAREAVGRAITSLREAVKR